MELHNLKPNTQIKKKKRVGRGSGSGRGTYSGRGIKGQKSRSGYKIPSSTLISKLPKLRGEGFRNVSQKEVAVVNLVDLENKFKTNEMVSMDSLIKKGIIKFKKNKSIKKVKILGTGKLSKKLKFDESLLFSKKARESIEKAKTNVRDS